MFNKKIILGMGLLLVAPTLFLGAGNLTNVSAATDSAVVAQSQWSDVAINKTIHAKNLIGMPVYDANGNVLLHQSAAADAQYQVSVERKNNATGQILYEISDGVYLDSSEVETGVADMQVSYDHAIIHSIDSSNIPLYDQNGNVIPGVNLQGNYYWYTNQEIYDRDSGNSYFQVSTNRYVSEQDIDSYQVAYK